jgi:hypothetical protein
MSGRTRSPRVGGADSAKFYVPFAFAACKALSMRSAK